MKEIKSEKDLQAYINKDLRKIGIKFIHLEKGAYNKGRTHRAGFPDLAIFKGNGLVFFVELKYKTTKLRDEQIEFLDWSMKNGYQMYVVKSIPEWEMIKQINGML